jgi:CheY-like chemotaxis protein
MQRGLDMASSSPHLDAARRKTPQSLTHTRTVLLIGNTEDNQEVLKPILDALGCRVVIVPSHGRALEFLFEHCPTLMLIDTSVSSRMPLSHFISTVRSRYPKLHIGMTCSDAKASEGQLGDFHLAHPLQLDDVISTLENWTGSRRKR